MADLAKALDQFYSALHAKPRKAKEPCSLVSFKKMKSGALGVRRADAAKARERARKHGLAVDYGDDGKPVITSSRQFRELAKLDNLRHLGY